MRILEVRMNNFMPYRGQQRVQLDTSEQANVVIVLGDNMRGKTSFLNALRWCMYGKAYGRHLREIPRKNLINMRAAASGDWDCSVQLIFEEKESHYVLSRNLRRRPLVDQPRDDEDFDMARAMTKDGAPVPDDQFDAELNTFLPEQVSRFFLFDGELLQEYEMLLLEDDPHGQRLKSEIEKVLGVPALVRSRDLLRSLLTQSQKALSRESRQVAELEALARKLDELQEAREARLFALAELRSKELELTQRIEEDEQILAGADALLQRKARLDELRGRHSELLAREQELDHERKSLLKDAWRDLLRARARALLGYVEQKLSALDAVIGKRAVLEDRLKSIDRMRAGEECTECGGMIGADVVNRAMKRAQEIQRQLQEMHSDEVQREEAVKATSVLRRILARDASARLVELDRKRQINQVEVTTSESQIEEIQAEIRGQDTESLARVRQRKENLLATRARNQKSISDESQVLENLEREIGQVSAILAKASSGANTRTARFVDTYQQLENVFTKSVDALRAQLKEEVAERATVTFRALTTEKSYSRLRINQNYGLCIEDADGRVVVERSAGAEQIVALSLIDGLNQTAGSRGPIVMDTPFGRLDPKHRANVLRHLPSMSEQVFLLVHEGEFNKHVDVNLISDRISKTLLIERVSEIESRIVTERRE